MQPTPRQAGFTLLEMLAALAALGLLAVLLAGSVQFGARAWESQGGRIASYTGPDAVHAVLRSMLRSAQTLPLAGRGSQGAASYFIGTADAFDFVGALPEALGGNGYYDIGIRLRPHGRLLLRWRPHAHSAKESVATVYDEVELLRNVVAIEMSYFVTASDNQPAGWRATWVQPSAMPPLIRMRIRFAPGDRRIWQILEVAPLVGSATG